MPVEKFNPCFHGSRSSARRLGIIRERRHVSILVFMDLGDGVNATRYTSPKGRVSILFSWISVIGIPDEVDLDLPIVVSILVFMDLGHRRTTGKTVGQSGVGMFQSLFSWISVIGGCSTKSTLASKSVSILVFISVIGSLNSSQSRTDLRVSNPCFHGSRSSANPRLAFQVAR